MTFISLSPPPSLSLSPLSLSPLSPPLSPPSPPSPPPSLSPPLSPPPLSLSLLSCNYSDPTLLYFYPTGFKGFLYFTQF
jgi:hypothetical protein